MLYTRRLVFIVSEEFHSPIQYYFDNRSSLNSKEHAEMFADFFKSNFTDATSQSNSIANHTKLNETQYLNQFLMDENLIFDELMKIDVKKGIGPDDIHPLLLKNCAAILYRGLYTNHYQHYLMNHWPRVFFQIGGNVTV